MKKVFVGLLISCMLLGSVPVFAAEAEVASEPIEVNWSDIVEEAEAAGSDIISQGEFYTFEDVAVQMWVPSVMMETELTEEDVENGYIAYFATSDEDAAAAVVYIDAAGMDLAAYKEMLAEDEEVTGLADGIFNGISCIGYDLEEKDTSCIAFETEAGYILEFSFAPVSDENYAGVIAMMMASIQPQEESDTEA